MKGCGGVWDVPTLEHALSKAKDEAARARNPRLRREREKRAEYLARLLELAQAAIKTLEQTP